MVVPRESSPDDTEAAVFADAGTSRAVIDVTKHEGLVSLPGFPFGPLTYVWYQFHFTMMAKGVVDAEGPNVLRRLWEAFALTDDQLAGVLGARVHPHAGQWLASWDELSRWRQPAGRRPGTCSLGN